MGVRIVCVIAVLVAAQHPCALKANPAGQTNQHTDAAVKEEDGPSKAERIPNLLRKAEAVTLKAASLRRQQTGKALLAAIPLLQESARLFTSIRAYDRAADSYFQIGEIDSTLGAYDKSLTAYEESLRLAENQRQRCRSSSRVTQIYAWLGAYNEAGTSLKKTLESCAGLSDKDALGEESLAQAEVLYYSGESTQSSSGMPLTSESFYSRARSLFAESGNREREAWALLHLGYVRFEKNPKEAVNLTEEAIQIWSSLRDQQGIAQTRQALGIFAAAQGQFETAQCNSVQAVKVFHELTDKDSEGIMLNNMGKVSREIGEPEASLGYYRRAKLSFAAVHDHLGEAEAITGIAAALSAMGEYSRLPFLYQEKLRLAEKAKNDILTASALVNLAEIQDRNQHFAEAETLYRRSAAIYQSNGHRRGQSNALLSLAHLQIEQHRDMEALSTLEAARILNEGIGDQEGLAKIGFEIAYNYRHIRKFEDALAAIERAIGIIDARVLKHGIDDQEGLAKIGFEVAYIYRRMGRLEKAQAAIERTIRIIESQRLQIANFDSRAAYFAAVHRYYSLYIQVLMGLHKLHPEQGFAQRAFEASEKSKVRSLLDLLTVSSQNSPCDELLKNPINAEPLLGNSHQAEDAVAPSPAVLNLQQIQAEIQDDDIILEYALGDESSYLWAVDRNHMASWELPASAQLGKLVKSFLGNLVLLQQRKDEPASDYAGRLGKAHQAYNAHAAQLSQLLIGQLSLSPEKRLLIVPDAFLQSIPFSALPLSETGKKNAVLLNDHEIVVLPSASALDALRKAAAKRLPPTAGIAVLADPVFEPHQSETRSSSANVDRQRPRSHLPILSRALRDVHGSDDIPPLPGSRAEAESIKRIFGQRAHLALKYDANRKAVLNGLVSSYRVVHFATHGIIDTRHPEMSGLVLSLFNEQGRAQDGYLRLGDIYKLKLSADLVVLSSCESALGKELESEGMIGLPRGFLYAGSKSVISSLWKVDDRATKELMTLFYSELHAGKSPAAALRSAQSTLARDPYWKSPYYWAAFILQGEYK